MLIFTCLGKLSRKSRENRLGLLKFRQATDGSVGQGHYLELLYVKGTLWGSGRLTLRA